MSLTSQLYEIRSAVCRHYDSTLWELCQRKSNNSKPPFSDVDVLVSYLFGLKTGLQEKKAIHRFLSGFCGTEFPNIPCYGQYCARVNKLAPVFERLNELLSAEPEVETDVHLLDSMPVVVASRGRRYRAKTAPDICGVGFCASKNLQYYGVRIHALAEERSKHMPVIRRVSVTPGDVHDLPAAKSMLAGVRDITIYADKAYNDTELGLDLEMRNCDLELQYKLTRGGFPLEDGALCWNAEHSRVRQMIETKFSSMQRSTGIQNASCVRSSSGLLSFIYAKLALVALFYS